LPDSASKVHEPVVLYRDDYYVAVHKPSGLLVHRTALAREETFLLQLVRDLVGQRVYPVHRLDRGTSGVVVFGLAPEAVTRMQLENDAVRLEKRYRAVVRGWVSEAGVIDHPVADRDAGTAPKPAVTEYRPLFHTEINQPVDRYPTARYTLVEARPVTGRRHQIRYHFKHISHPIIGDTTYGKGSHNRFFRENFGIDRLMLQSAEMTFTHPYSGERVQILAAEEEAWSRIERVLRWRKMEQEI
jgi:tRNA pseudouridine65 synthase